MKKQNKIKEPKTIPNLGLLAARAVVLSWRLHDRGHLLFDREDWLEDNGPIGGGAISRRMGVDCSHGHKPQRLF